METSEKFASDRRKNVHRCLCNRSSSASRRVNDILFVIQVLMCSVLLLTDRVAAAAVTSTSSSWTVSCSGSGCPSAVDLMPGRQITDSSPNIVQDARGVKSDYSQTVARNFDKDDASLVVPLHGVLRLIKASATDGDGQRGKLEPPGRNVRSAPPIHRHSGGSTSGGGGAIRKHDEPVQFPVTFRTSGAYLVTKLKLYATFSIYFQLKTTQADGLIMFSGSLDASKGQDFIAVEMFEGHLRYVFDVGSGVRVIQDRLGQPINDNRWHEVSILRESIGQHVLRVDDSTSIDILPDSRSVHYDLPADGSFYVGGLPSVSDISGIQASPSATTVSGLPGAVTAAAAAAGAILPGRPHLITSVSVPRLVRSRGIGFQGCLGSIDLNGDRWRLIDRRDEVPVEMRNQIIDGCDGPSTECTPTTCKNGGVCIQQWNSFVCDCNSTSFVGLHCTDESIAYMFGQLGGLVTFSYPETERPDTRHDRLTLGFSTVQSDAILAVITSATSKDYIEVQLVDGALFVVYNVGLSNHPVGELEHKVNDGNYHIMRFQRRGQNASLQLDERPPYVKHPPGRQLTTFNHQGWVTVGGKRDANGRLVRPFQGTIAGFVWNGLWILELAADSDRRVKIDGDVELDMSFQRSRDVSSSSSSSSSSVDKGPASSGTRSGAGTRVPPATSTPMPHQCLMNDKKCGSKEKQVADEEVPDKHRPNGKSDVVNVESPEASVVDSFQRDNGSLGGRSCPVNDPHCRHTINPEPSSSSMKPDRQLHNISSTGKHVPLNVESTSLLPASSAGRPETLTLSTSPTADVITPSSALSKPAITINPTAAANGSDLRTSSTDRRTSFQTSTIRNFPSAAVIVDSNNHSISSSNSSNRVKLSAVFPSPSTNPPVTSSSRSAGGTSAGRISVVATAGVAFSWPNATIIAGAAGGAVAMTVVIAFVAFAVCRYRSREQGTYNLDAATSINGYAYEPCDTTITVGIPTSSTGVGLASAAVPNGSSPPLLPPPPPSVLNGGGGVVGRGRTLGRRRSKSIGNGGGGSSTASSIASSSAANGTGATGSLGRRTTPRTKKVVREWYV